MPPGCTVVHNPLLPGASRDLTPVVSPDPPLRLRLPEATGSQTGRKLGGRANRGPNLATEGETGKGFGLWALTNASLKRGRLDPGPGEAQPDSKGTRLGRFGARCGLSSEWGSGMRDQPLRGADPGFGPLGAGAVRPSETRA